MIKILKIFFQTYPLTSLLSCCCIVYHLVNAVGGGFWVPRKQWKRTHFELRSKEKVWFRLPILGENPAKFTDSASEIIGGVGYVAKYLAHQLPPMVVYGTSHPIQQFFHRENLFFQYPSSERWISKGLIPNLKNVVEHVSGAGITTVVLPIPSKSAIERKYLPTPLPPIDIWGSNVWRENGKITQNEPENPYGVYRTILHALPNHTVDLFRAYSDFRKLHSDFIYLPFEVHWTSLGAAVAAAEIIEKLRAQGWELSKPIIRWTKNRPNIDQWLFVILPRFYLESSPVFNWKEPLYEIEPTTSKKPLGRLVLAGTSFSNRIGLEGIGFGSVLAKALRRELVDFSKPGDGLKGPLSKMKDCQFKLHENDLFVVETPMFLVYPSTVAEGILPLPKIEKGKTRDLASVAEPVCN